MRLIHQIRETNGGDSLESMTQNIAPSYFPMGEQAIVVQFENDISIEISARVQTLAHRITSDAVLGVKQLIPAFNNLTVCYDPLLINYDELLGKLKSLEMKDSNEVQHTGKTISIPVAFGGKYGPDLAAVAEKSNLSAEEVISMLQSKPYYVYMIGFIAGYPYCGDIDRQLNFPRRSSPRAVVQKGSIQIVNHLTGVFTMTAPSGWHVVGWTPMEIFNPHREPPSIIQAGDAIQYMPIEAEEAEQWDETKQREWNRLWNT